ncbi:TolC family protein [Arachidicoccus terrestris]|uniref:TolC family protein n=1 Tax=Arachidicoccus terrestris TaxID=2875539 RepID=UPI001CC68A57|nr:TolC family protein [Arachidicoccus terrestris]UAY54885.1 TolC family protein [Arachidicoccus terrestris]
MKKLKLLAAFLAAPMLIFAQQSETWDLQRCVQYALDNNISVKQSDVQARLDALTLKQAKANQIPTLSFNTQGGYNFGRSVDPTTNQFTTNRVLFQSYGIQTGVTLFNFFRVQNDIKAKKIQGEASASDIERAKSDVTLNVAAAYLQYLLAKEQVNIAKGQIELTTNQLDLTKKQVEAGALPELNAAQLASQLATDSSTYITNVTTMEQNKLQLLALLNLSADAPFEVSLPDVDKIPLEPISELQPDALYKHAVQTQYQQRVDSLKILSAKYAAKSARAALYPTLSAFGSVGSNYASSFMTQTGSFPYMDTIGTININGKDYYSTAQGQIPVYGKASYGKQIFDINLSQAVGISLNIPIFNNRQSRTAWEQAKLNVTNLQLQQAQNNQTLQQDIYTAYTNAKSGIEKFNANTKGASYAQYAYHLAELRYENGMLSASDYLVAQNNLYTAKINQSAARYEYIFRLKVLEFYKFNQIHL